METNLNQEENLEIREHASFSALNSLRVSPLAYRKYKDRETSEQSDNMDLGNIVHTFILESSEFYNRYVVADYDVPSGKYGVYTRILAELNLLSNSENKNVLNQIPRYVRDLAFEKSELAYTEDRAWRKLQADSELLNYYQSLINLGNKKLVSTADYATTVAIQDSIQNHKLANELMFLDPLGSELEYNEEQIEWTNEYGTFMKAVIDRIVLNPITNVIKVIDLKTTAKNVHLFSKSYYNYGYYRQLAIYYDAILAWIKQNGLGEQEEWKIELYIVAVQTTGNNECVVYVPHVKDIEKGTEEYKQLCEELNWHYSTEQWNFPRSYYEGDGTVGLQLEDYDDDDEEADNS